MLSFAYCRLKSGGMKHYNDGPMEVEEHFYSDDPGQGPPDAWTTLPGVDYYFLGNGRIQAAVQVCSKGPGTAAGLLIMDPYTLGPKSRALSFAPDSGLRPTLVTIATENGLYSAAAERVRAGWVRKGDLPAVRVAWPGRGFICEETFFCPDRRRPRVGREITIKRRSKKTLEAVLRTGVGERMLSRRFSLAGGKVKTFFLEYRLRGRRGRRAVEMDWRRPSAASKEASLYWRQASRMDFSSPLLDRFYKSSLFQLQANMAASGKLDGGIWQYNREWTRDLAMAAVALTQSGQFEPARTLLRRLLEKFVTAAGDTIDSSERRQPGECELDQNGVLLYALETYTLWTGDRGLVRKHWPRVRAAARFPLRKTFRHAPSGLLHNRREFWERHAVHGIEDGMELAGQFWVSLGLSSAARLARLVGEDGRAAQWEKQARQIKESMLGDKNYGLVRHGCFIKRRTITGEIEENIRPLPSSGLPPGMPLFGSGPHRLNPDTSTALPIAWSLVPPQSQLARRTLARLELLWNQRWRGGGYGRYHVSSEPDSPGPWPFPSLFAARAYLEAGDDSKVWRVLRWLDRAPGGRAGSWFEFYGRRPIPPYPQVGIVPWTWVELLILSVHHLAGLRPEWSSFRLRPRLLRGLPGFAASFRLRGARVNLTVERAGKKKKPGFLVNGKFRPYDEEGLSLPYPRKNLRIRAWVPGSLGKTDH
jgi:hypothetical protein